MLIICSILICVIIWLFRRFAICLSFVFVFLNALVFIQSGHGSNVKPGVKRFNDSKSNLKKKNQPTIDARTFDIKKL